MIKLNFFFLMMLSAFSLSVWLKFLYESSDMPNLEISSISGLSYLCSCSRISLCLLSPKNWVGSFLLTYDSRLSSYILFIFLAIPYGSIDLFFTILICFCLCVNTRFSSFASLYEINSSYFIFN